MNPLRILYIILGFTFFGLGAVGAFVPVLPTVPFLLIASFFFSRGSKRFEKWFISTKLYQNHLESFLRNHSMTRKTKLYIQALATGMLVISVIVVPLIPIKIFLIALMLFMYYYFARRIKTVSPEEEIIILSEDEVWRESRENEEPVTLRETVHEIKAMHEELFEEAREETSVEKNPGNLSSL